MLANPSQSVTAAATTTTTGVRKIQIPVSHGEQCKYSDGTMHSNVQNPKGQNEAKCISLSIMKVETIDSHENLFYLHSVDCYWFLFGLSIEKKGARSRDASVPGFSQGNNKG